MRERAATVALRLRPTNIAAPWTGLKTRDTAGYLLWRCRRLIFP